MSGNKYLLDTNALIAFLKGDPNISHLKGSSSLISIVSVLEFLSFPILSEKDKTTFFDFIKTIEVVEVNVNNSQLIETITDLRKANRIKLPDAIIAGSAIHSNAVLLTNDKGFYNIPKLEIHSF